MTNTLRARLSVLSTTLLAVALFLAFMPLQTKAASQEFAPSNCYSSAATTSLSYMTAGTATTTVTCALGPTGTDSASLALLVNASSTSSVVVGQVEYSEDGIDWYQNNQDVFAAGAIAIATPSNSFTWTYASTTVGGAAVGAATNAGTKILKISTPMKWVRVVLSNTGTNIAVWAKIIPRKPIN